MNEINPINQKMIAFMALVAKLPKIFASNKSTAVLSSFATFTVTYFMLFKFNAVNPGRMSSLKSSHFDVRVGGNLSMGGKLM